MTMRWKEINLPGLTTDVPTADAQPLSRAGWPTWVRESTDFVAGWLCPTGSSRAASTAVLSTGCAQAYIDFERIAPVGPPLRYNRYVYAQLSDGRTFQFGPIKDVEYGHHRWGRPRWLVSSLATQGS
jgi:hypothetical protein